MGSRISFNDPTIETILEFCRWDVSRQTRPGVNRVNMVLNDGTVIEYMYNTNLNVEKLIINDEPIDISEFEW